MARSSGFTGRTHTPEARARIGAAARERHLGRNLSPEHRAAISKGMQEAPEMLARIGAAARERNAAGAARRARDRIHDDPLVKQHTDAITASATRPFDVALRRPRPRPRTFLAPRKVLARNFLARRKLARIIARAFSRPKRMLGGLPIHPRRRSSK